MDFILFSKNSSLPNNIILEGKYSEEVDINMLHRHICNKLRNTKSEIDGYIASIEALKVKKKQRRMTIVEAGVYESEIEELERKIEETTNDKYEEYIQKIGKHLQEYNSSNVYKMNKNKEENPERFSLLQTIFKIMNDYDPEVNIIVETPASDGICAICFSNTETDGETTVCSTCGNTLTSSFSTIAFSDNSRVSSNVNNYRNIKIFKKLIESYQGKHTPKWGEKYDVVCELAMEYCAKNNINYKNVTPDDCYTHLFKAIEYPEYSDAILFCNLFNGWELPNITEHIKDINEDYEQIYLYYEEEKEGTSATNRYIILLQILQRRNIPYDIRNFKIPQTEDIKLRADRVLSRIFSRLEEKRRETHSNTLPWIHRPLVS